MREAKVLQPEPATVVSGRTGPDVAVITTLAGVCVLAPEWRALIARSEGATPFQRPEWLLPWYEIWAPRAVQVYTARTASGQLAALVPCVRQPGCLELAGGGVSDYPAPIVGASVSEPVFDALDEALGAARLPICFHDVPRESPWIAVARRPRSRWSISSASICPRVRLESDPAAWRRTLAPGLQRNLRRYGERIADECGARLATIDDRREAEWAIEALVDVHTKRWHAQRRPGVFAGEDVRRFHRMVAPALIARGVLRLHIITVGATIIAAQYVLQDPPQAFSYIGGFDPEWGRYSPGTLLMAYSIERAIEDGCTSFDLLRGTEPYKYTWGAADTQSLTLTRAVDGP